MSAVNGLVGGGFERVASAPDTDATQVPTASLAAADGVEWYVALMVLAALGVIVLFRMAGFQAVIATSAKIGG